MKIFYVYILECSDKTFYTGITSNLTKRLESHQAGNYKGSYTSSRRPVELAFYCEFTDPNMAIETEKQIKKWSQAKKRALISGAYENCLIWQERNSTVKGSRYNFILPLRS